MKLNLFGQFARTLGTLLQNGVPVLTALKITEQVIANRIVKEAIAKTRDAVTDGKTLAQPLEQSKIFPQLMVDLVRIGEETGDVPGALNNLAGTYENELQIALRVVTQPHRAHPDHRDGAHRGLPADQHFAAAVPADFTNSLLSLAMKTAVARKTIPRRAFTLIEIMIVVAIIGLIAAMGVPSILQTFRKEGMRKAVSDVMDLCSDARAQAIFSGQPAADRFLSGGKTDGTGWCGQRAAAPVHADQKAARSVTLPDSVDIAMLDIEMIDCGGQEKAWVNFNPNGTCDELTLVLHCGDEWQKITLEYSTALASVGPVTR